MIEIDNLIKDALKNKQTVELKVYRNLKADIIAFKTQKNAPEYNEASEISIIRKYATKMEDAEKQYSQAGREDLATECREELEVLKKLLPKPVDAQDINSILAGWCVRNNFVNTENELKIEIPKKSMGLAIKAMKEVFPTADGKIISEVVKQYVI
jgi:uncharacterized protein YqeY